MRRVILITALIFATTTTLISCRETTTETNETETIREVEVERSEPEVTEERKGILERTGEEVDREVNEEIDKEIDRIGD